MSQTIEQLAKKRQRWIDANKENNFDEGIKRLLTELYPDNAHFIYELLQNAEDTGASVVRFTLSENAIDFEHNGQRLFDLKDIDSITSIGVSTKHDDPTNIGKFGVGFKAVFAYTETPEIHSGEFHFRINDMVVPTVDGVINSRPDANETIFTFPFNHPTKKSSRAVEEIERGLRVLGAHTLLFLNHINTVEYLLPDGSLGYLRRTDCENGRIEISACPPGGEEIISHWLRYQKNVEIAEEDGAVKACQVAIAYSLQPEEQIKKNQPEWKIVPLDHGQVSIYFPAEKETSKLRFHIHAPFASTVARDSVRDCNENIQLLDSISQLLVESLDDILARRMLTMGFLAVLPNSADNLSLFYKPLFKVAVKAFQEKPLTPTRSGNHAPAAGLYRGPVKVAKVFGDDGLAVLTNGEFPLWAANPPPQSQREDRFLDSLMINNWGLPEFSSALVNADYKECRRRVEAWIAQKDDVWVMHFYELLGDLTDTLSALYLQRASEEMRIVRVTTRVGQEHVLPTQAFFPPEQNATPPQNIYFVKPSVYRTGSSDAQKNNASAFLQQIGVRSFNIKTSIELKLAQYSNLHPAEVDTNEHFRDVEQFIDYFKSSSDIQLFKNKDFLFSETEDGSLCWHAPDQICIDAPFLRTELGQFTSIHGKHVLWDGYMQNLKKIIWEDFRDFLLAAGVLHNLSVEEVNVFENPHKQDLLQDWYNGARWMSSTAKYNDFSIPGIEKYIAKKSIFLSNLIWIALIKADRKVATAYFCPNNQCVTSRADSQLVYHLKAAAWIPSKDGVFRKPQHMTRDLLPDDFPYDDRNGLLTAIDFGKDAEERKEAQLREQERQTSEYKHKEEIAKEMGFESPEEAEETAKLRRENPEEFEKWKKEMRSRKQQPAFPERPVPNPERRQEKMGKQLSKSPDKRYEKRSRSMRTTTNAIDPTTWLRNHYTNEDDQMVCQICKEEMPFRKRDGKHYFEKKEVLSLNYLAKEHEAQYLALCPLCAAKYEEFVKKEGDAMSNLQKSIANAVSCEVPISLGDQQTSIRFVEAHLLDLQTIIECMD